MKALALPDRGNRPTRQPRITAQAAAVEDGCCSALWLPAGHGSFSAFPILQSSSRRAHELAFTVGTDGPALGRSGRRTLVVKQAIPEGRGGSGLPGAAGVH